MKERAIFSVDILAEGNFFFEEIQYDPQSIKKKWKVDSPEQLTALAHRLSALTPFLAAHIETAFATELKEKNLSFGQLGPVFRIALTGRFTGPSAFMIAEILGKAECLRRIDLAVQNIK